MYIKTIPRTNRQRSTAVGGISVTYAVNAKILCIILMVFGA